MKKLLLILACLFTLPAAAQKVDSCAYWKAKCDTLSHRNFILGAEVDWVQYYLALMQRRPKDTVYSRGWLMRAIANKLPANPYVSIPAKKQVHKPVVQKALKKR